MIILPGVNFKNKVCQEPLIGLKDSKEKMKVLLSYERLFSNVFCDVATLQRLHF